MTIASHVEKNTEAGFTRAISPETARQQFSISLALVGVIAIAAVAVTLTLRMGPTGPDSASARAYVQAPQMIHVQHASRGDQRPDG